MRRTVLPLILIAAVLTGPLAVGAQQAGKLPTIGVLEPYPAADPIKEQIRQALRAVGYAEGRDIIVEWRYGDGQTARLPAFATELARLKLDAIMAIGDLAITAAKKATTTTRSSRVPTISWVKDTSKAWPGRGETSPASAFWRLSST